MAFSDVELNTRIKTVIITSNAFWAEMYYTALVRGVALEHGFILSSKQEEAILAFLQNQDVVISLPTSYGKSLCYSLLPPPYIIS